MVRREWFFGVAVVVVAVALGLGAQHDANYTETIKASAALAPARSGPARINILEPLYLLAGEFFVHLSVFVNIYLFNVT